MSKNLSYYTQFNTVNKPKKVKKLLPKVSDVLVSSISNKKLLSKAYFLHCNGYSNEAYNLIKTLSFDSLEGEYKGHYIDIVIAYMFEHGDLTQLIDSVKKKYQNEKHNYRLFEICSDYIKTNQLDFIPLIEILDNLGVYESYIDLLKVRNAYINKEYQDVIDSYQDDNLLSAATMMFENELMELTYYSMLALKQDATKLKRKLVRRGVTNLIDHEINICETVSLKDIENTTKKKRFAYNPIIVRILIVIFIVLSINFFVMGSKREMAVEVDLTTTYQTSYQDLISKLDHAKSKEDYNAFKILFEQETDADYIAERFSEINHEVGEAFGETYLIDLDTKLVYYHVYYMEPIFNSSNSIYEYYTYNDYLVIDKQTGLFTDSQLTELESRKLVETLYPETKGHTNYAFIFDFPSIFNPSDLEVFKFDVRSVVFNEESNKYEVYFNMFNGKSDKFSISNFSLLIGTDQHSVVRFKEYDLKANVMRNEIKYFKVEISKRDFEKATDGVNLDQLFFSVEYNYIDR